MNRNGSEFVFPTRNGTPRKHRTQLLELCKAIAKRAKLNPDDFFLHKFRATFATKHLQAGVDLRTVQLWLGHKDIESTMRYLKPARGKGFGMKAECNVRGLAIIAPCTTSTVSATAAPLVTGA